ncbi:MAG: hypothetical protein JO362_21990 [Streptomycetaceae bacterium]|nr:hypothetical protein [Streptomycetaceae bacterium]
MRCLVLLVVPALLTGCVTVHPSALRSGPVAGRRPAVVTASAPAASSTGSGRPITSTPPVIPSAPSHASAAAVPRLADLDASGWRRRHTRHHHHGEQLTRARTPRLPVRPTGAAATPPRWARRPPVDSTWLCSEAMEYGQLPTSMAGTCRAVMGG